LLCLQLIQLNNKICINWAQHGGTPIIPATWEAKIGRIKLSEQSRQKVSETPISTNKLGIFAGVYNPSYRGGIGRKIMAQVSPKKKSTRAYLKNN
jgi:hypothetical protein